MTTDEDAQASEPLAGTIERWAWDYVTTTSLAHKLAPPELPERWEEDERREIAPPRRMTRPGRPPELRVVARAEKTRGLGAPEGRARALHTFLHHELQAAELMCWALLAYPATPREFRAGLVRIARDEVRHMSMYHTRIRELGHEVGAFVVRDWFWERVPQTQTPAAFVALMGLGVESANLEHAATFAARFREVGDEASARIEEQVGLEEVAHVRFGARWFRHFTGEELSFEAWRRLLPPPLTPLLMRGRPLQRDARLRAGQPSAFIDALDAWEPDPPHA